MSRIWLSAHYQYAHYACFFENPEDLCHMLRPVHLMADQGSYLCKLFSEAAPCLPTRIAVPL